MSGPIALRCSQFVVKELNKSERKEVLLTVDLFPDLSSDEVYNQSMALAKADAKKAIKNVLKPLLSDRLIPIMLEKSGLDDQLTYDNIPKQKWLELCKLMKAFPVIVKGTLSIEEAFVTGGGVQLKEIDPSTMQSKLVNGLYFCGEILDIHGYTGGYNITAAFSTGYMAGKSAAQQV